MFLSDYISNDSIIEVVYEDNVLKPLEPIEGIKEHERVIAYLTRRPVKKGLHKLVGTLVSSQPYNVYKYAINTPYNSTL